VTGMGIATPLVYLLVMWVLLAGSGATNDFAVPKASGSLLFSLLR
jgi:hypothetical protein